MSAPLHRFGSLQHGICEACDDPVAINTFGWYRCRSCGHESLRPFVENSANPRGASAPQARRALGLSLSPTSHKERAR